MDFLISAVRQANAQQNPYAAFTLALALPDICASVESEDGKTTGAKYASWWDTYVGPSYRSNIGALATEHVFMTGGDCYALRCAFLHQGIDDVTTQRARAALRRFHLVQPADANTVIHCNQAGAALNLQVNLFTEDICVGAEAWMKVVGSRADVAARLSALMKINDLSGGFSF